MVSSGVRRRPRLADVAVSALAATTRQASETRESDNVLGLSEVSRAVVVLVDGLGADALRERSGHARTLITATQGKRGTLVTGAPTTTAAAVTSLVTGADPGEHGIVSYSALDRANDRVLNQISGWDARTRAADWQRVPTVFERATSAGIESAVFADARHRDSEFTVATLRGAAFVGASDLHDRVDAVEAALRDPSGPRFAYLYIAELDKIAHKRGWESPDWSDGLESVDAALSRLASALGPRDGMLVTADHGMIDIPEHGHRVLATNDPLLAGVDHVAGEPRLLHLGVSADSDPHDVVTRWRARFGDEVDVLTADDAIAAGWFGTVSDSTRDRIGDVLVAARKRIIITTERQYASGVASMVGHHGAWTDAETRVPLARFGAWA